MHKYSFSKMLYLKSKTKLCLSEIFHFKLLFHKSLCIINLLLSSYYVQFLYIYIIDDNFLIKKAWTCHIIHIYLSHHLRDCTTYVRIALIRKVVAVTSPNKYL